MVLGSAAEVARQGLSRSTLRRLLLRLAPTPAEFDSLCIDYAPQVRQHFTSGMDRLSQTNLLLRLLPATEVLAALQGLAPDPGEFEQLLTQLRAEPRNARECELEALSQRLEECLLERDRLRSQVGLADAAALDALTAQIVDLKRQIRRGPQLNAGEILDERYILCQLIGRGGYGDVWQALDRSRGGFVAIKVLHGRREDPRSVERFERGARTMRQLDHPHIVRVLEEPADHDDFHYYVMEYLAGGDLERALTQGQITQEQALRAILQAGEALEYAHARGMVHRDVKPQNILLDGQNGAHLTDFDLVLAEDSTGGTGTGAFVGTLLYVAPEVLDDAGLADARSDVYSLGMSLLFVLYGRPLPRSGSRDSLLGACQQAAPALLDIVRRATAWGLSERYARAANFCDDLRLALHTVGESLRDIASTALPSPAISQAVTLPRLPVLPRPGWSSEAPTAELVMSVPLPSQNSASLTGYALPPEARTTWSRPTGRTLFGALAIATVFGAGYSQIARLRHPPAGPALAATAAPAQHSDSAANARPIPKPPVAAEVPVQSPPANSPAVAMAAAGAPRQAVSPPQSAGPGPDDGTDKPRKSRPTPAPRPATPARGSSSTGAYADELNSILSRPPAPSPAPRSAPAGSHSAVKRVWTDITGVLERSPSRSSPVPAASGLANAQTAYLNHNYQGAIDLARAAQGENPVRAWRIIGTSACELEDLALAADAYRRLDAPSRQYMLYVCQRHHLALSGNEFVKLAGP